MSKFWRVEYDRMTLFVAYVKAETEAEAFAVAKTLEEDEMQEISTTWDGPNLEAVDEEEALDGGVVFRPDDGEK